MFEAGMSDVLRCDPELREIRIGRCEGVEKIIDVLERTMEVEDD